MQKPIWSIFIVTFILGALLIFGASRKYAPLAIVMHAHDGSVRSMDSLSRAYQCYPYTLSTDTTFSAVIHNVKWRIGADKWIIDDPIVDEYEFTELGKIPIQVYIDGKLRGSRFVIVEPCPGASVYIPEKIRQGDSHRFKDNTKGSVSRKWYIKNSVSSDFKEYEDQGGVLDFEFDYSGPYVIRAQVVTSDTTYSYEKRIEVGKKREEERPKLAESSSKKEKPKSGAKENVQTGKETTTSQVTPDKVEEEVLAEAIEEEESYSEASEEKLSDYFGKSFMVDETWKVEESTWFFDEEKCLQFNGDQRTLFLRNLKADLCLTNLYFVPNLDITGNKVKISIENTKDVDRKFVKRPIIRTLSRTNTGLLSTVNVKSIGCYLKKGESYKIIVDPEEGYEVGEVDKTDYSCISGMEEFKHAEVQVQSKTKILKIEYKLRE